MSNASTCSTATWACSPGRTHVCQLHQREPSLIDAAVRYLLPGLSSSENIVIVTRKNRMNAILNWLNARGHDIQQLEEENRLFVRSSSDLIDAIFEDDLPDWDAFDRLVTDLFESASQGDTRRLRVYGDAVGDLWEAGNHRGAIRLEEYWTEFQERTSYSFSVFCGYLIDALNPGSYSDYLPQLAQTHHFTLPTPDSIALHCALEGAVREMLEHPLLRNVSPERTAKAGTGLPLVYQTVTWLREKHPESISVVLSRARELYKQAL